MSVSKSFSILLLLAGLAGSSWAAEPLVTLSAMQINFPPLAQDTSSPPLQVVLANSGGADLTITSITITGLNSADFSETSTCPVNPAVLGAGGHCEIVLTCRPKVLGALSATLTIADSASGSPRSVAITGVSTTAAPMAAFAPGSVAFGNQAEGSSSAAHVVILTNSGSATLNINSAISITGAGSSEFHLQRTPNSCPEASGQLPAKASCEIAVVFSPATISSKNAQITVVSDAPGSPHNITLSGTGSAAQTPAP